MSLGFSGKELDSSVRAAANPMKAGDVDRCLQSCAIYFLGLQNNRFAIDLFAGKARSRNEYSGQDQQQVFGRFPSNNDNGQKRFRTGLDPKVAAVSNQCIGTCLYETSVAMGAGFLGGAQASVYFGGGALYVGLATGIVAGAMKGLQCSTSSACSKTRAQELQEEKASRLKADNDVEEQELRAHEIRRQKEEKANLDRDKREREEQQKKAQEQKAKAGEAKKEQERKQEEKHQETEKRIKDSYDPTKNKDAVSDSSASCETTHTCDGTMNALTMPDKYREASGSDSKTDGRGNIITPRDMTSTPQGKGMREDAGSSHLTDANGRQVTKKDMTSTPVKQQDIDSGASNSDHNGRVVTKKDMTSTPILSKIEPVSGPFNPNKNRGVNMVNSKTK